MNRLEELRLISHEVRRVQDDLGALAEEMKHHPAKPQPGAGKEAIARWTAIRAEFDTEREELRADLADLQEEQLRITEQYKAEPVPMASFGSIIAELVNIEYTFKSQGPDEAWSKLSGLIDHLEAEESRVYDILESA